MIYLSTSSANILQPASFFGFNLTRIQWVFVGLASSSVASLHAARQIMNLTTLIRMYPSQRRKLKFLTWHHNWLFNPFRSKWIRYKAKDLKSTRFTVLKIGRFRLTPTSHLNFYLLIQQYLHIYSFSLFLSWLEVSGSSVSLFVKIVYGSVIGILYTASSIFAYTSLDRAVSRHMWALWGYVYPWAKDTTY